MSQKASPTESDYRMSNRRLNLVREGLAAVSGLAVALILASSVAFESFGDLLRVVVTGGVFWLVAIVIYLSVRRLLPVRRRHQLEREKER